MKKRMALFLAAVMVMPPISAFAASENSLSRQISAVGENTVMFEEGALGNQLINLFPSNIDAASNEKIEHATDAPLLQIELKNNVAVGDIFKVNLSGADWFFRSNRTDAARNAELQANVAVIKAFVDTNGVVIVGDNPTTSLLSGGVFNVAATDTVSISRFGSLGASSFSAEQLNELGVMAYNTALTGTLTATGAAKLNGKTLAEAASIGLIPTTDITMTALAATNLVIPTDTTDFNTEGGQYLHDLTGIDANYVGGAGQLSTYDTTKGFYMPGTKTYYRWDDAGTALDYALRVSSTNDQEAYVTMISAKVPTDIITIPIVARSTTTGDLRVIVANYGNYTTVTANTLQFGIQTGTKTDTSIVDKVTSKYTFHLERIEVRERLTGSIRPGEIVLTAPYGYTFADPTLRLTAVEGKTSHYPQVSAFGDMYFRGGRTTMENVVDGEFMDYGTRTVNGNTVTDKSVIVIDTSATGLNLTPSRSTFGTLSILDLVLIADEGAPIDEQIELNIDGTGITEQDFIIGTRKDWGIELKTISDVKKLVNGRFAPTGSSSFDKDHKTAKVRFTENVVASWWGLRESEFRLPEGVKFRQIKITEEDNIDHINTSYKLNGTYTPQGSRVNYVDMNANRVRFYDVQVKRDETASFEMEMWVSIESGWEGDVLLTLGGDDILEETTPVKIATAVSPITIKTEIKDVRIGYQWQKVADFVITETEPGMLKRDTTVNLFIDDSISGNDSIAFAPDYITEVNTDSKILFSRPSVNDGEILFTIERQSQGKAASIKFSNVYIKIDRTVPETNKRPYAIVAGGDAIAANYKPRPTSLDPMFVVKGIGTGYFNVITSATNASSLFSNVVRVTIGSNEVIIGRDATTNVIMMDTSPYISAESNSTMVPIRFVSQAFGVPDNQIVWDSEARTVTIYNGSRVIQFKAGTSDITVNGVTTTMYSPDATPLKVKTEIKDNRAFLPFRALGYALGIDVDWDDSTQTAIYNAQLLEDTATATTDNTTVE
ncbi:MAG: copper amine oxidase N-terminal domain-containing protein [Clostridiales bacterium]|jgi:hypothetical protein|nr:copper amine oxidase N-terminal domain-containing protein [Clostridiales bacterium]